MNLFGNVTGEMPPVVELQNLRRENDRLWRITNLQAQLIDKLRHRGRIYEMDELEVDILNELFPGVAQAAS